MMIPTEVLVMLNEQLTHERANHAFYHACAAYFDALDLTGMRDFMRKQAGDEWGHAERIITYLGERGHAAKFAALAEVTPGPTTPQDIFAEAMQLELKTTVALKALHRAAETMDQQTAIFLQWFLTEQVEEEDTLNEICQRFARSANLGDEWMDRAIRDMVK